MQTRAVSLSDRWATGASQLWSRLIVLQSESDFMMTAIIQNFGNGRRVTIGCGGSEYFSTKILYLFYSIP